MTTQAKAHDHNHDEHDHHHEGGGHSHGPAHYGRAFALGFAINLAYVIGEAFYGVAGHSLALLADAGHNLGDVLGLAGGWAATILSQRQPSARYTYGLRRSSILTALGNAVLLLVVTGGIAWEALRRFATPEHPGGIVIMVVAAFGIVVNGGTALLFLSGRKEDLNVKGTFLHLASDALVSAGTVAAGALILWTGWSWLDPLVSIAVSAVIVAGTWSLLRASMDLSLDAVPTGIDRPAVEAYLRNLPGIEAVHDLHIWGLSTTDTALTAHLVYQDNAITAALLPRIATEIRERFAIGHATIQLETTEIAEACLLRSDQVF